MAFRSHASSSPSFIILLVTLTLIYNGITIGLVLADCPPGGCGPFGECLPKTRTCQERMRDEENVMGCEYTCKCNPGYFGADCSMQVDVCPDDVGPNGERTCLNGGKCHAKILQGDLVLQWQCDCRHAVGLAAVYAGIQCEYPQETSCEIDVDVSAYAFCTNNGKCKANIQTGQDHPGCHCLQDFEGRHCQYKKGTAPDEELIFEYEGNAEINKQGLSGFGVFMVTLVTLLMFGGGLFFVYHRLHQQHAMSHGDATTAKDDTMNSVVDTTASSILSMIRRGTNKAGPKPDPEEDLKLNEEGQQAGGEEDFVASKGALT